MGELSSIILIALAIDAVVVGAVCQLVIPSARLVPNSTMFGIGLAGVISGIVIGVAINLPGLWTFAVANVLAVSATMIGVEQAKRRGTL